MQEVLGDDVDVDDAEDAEGGEEDDPEDAETRLSAVSSVLKVDVANACSIVNDCLDNLEQYNDEISELLCAEEVQGAMTKDEWQQSEQHLENLRNKAKAWDFVPLIFQHLWVFFQNLLHAYIFFSNVFPLGHCRDTGKDCRQDLQDSGSQEKQKRVWYTGSCSNAG